MIAGFNVKDVAIGDGNTNSYNVGFVVDEVTDLLVWVQDQNGVIQGEYRGDDTTFLGGLTFNSDGETMTLALQNDLNDQWVLTFLMAPDQPDQETGFSNKFSFNLTDVEAVFDSLARFIQRVAYKSQRALVLHDLDDIDNFDPTLPYPIAAAAGYLPSVKSDASGFEFIVSTGQIALAQQNATLAAASASAAAGSAVSAAASAVAAAASAALANAGFYCTSTRLAPLAVNLAVGIVPNNKPRELQFVAATGGGPITANPQIAPGTVVGQELLLSGTSDVNNVRINNGSGTSQNGDMILGDGDAICYVWTGDLWTEVYRRSAN